VLFASLSKETGTARTNFLRAPPLFKDAAETHNCTMEAVFTTASKGASEYTAKLIEFLKANTTSTLDFAQELFGVKTPAEATELWTSHSRKSFETFSAQASGVALDACSNAPQAYPRALEGLFALPVSSCLTFSVLHCATIIATDRQLINGTRLICRRSPPDKCSPQNSVNCPPTKRDPDVVPVMADAAPSFGPSEQY
jgi:Phasin protein